MKRAAFAFVFVLLATAVLAAPAPGTLTDPVQEARARALQKELRCLVCQGESVDDSNAQFAAVVRDEVRAHIVAGESDEQIKDFLVSRYGNFILMKPPLDTQTYFLWLAPFGILMLGLGVTTFVVMRARKRNRQTPD